MSYDLNKLVKLSSLQQLLERIKNIFVTKEEISQAPMMLTFSCERLEQECEGVVDKTPEELVEAINSKKNIICVLHFPEEKGNKKSIILPNVKITSNLLSYYITADYWVVDDPENPAGEWHRCVWFHSMRGEGETTVTIYNKIYE